MAKSWTPEEDDFIKENYLKMKYKDIGEHLGRSTGSIANRVVYSLGLHKKNTKKSMAKGIVKTPRYMTPKGFEITCTHIKNGYTKTKTMKLNSPTEAEARDRAIDRLVNCAKYKDVKIKEIKPF